MTRTGGSLTGLRERNRHQVLAALRQRGTISRADIAKQTGLSTTTVSNLVAELLDEAVIVELPERTVPGAGAGRPARRLAFNPAAGGSVGVHLAHDHLRVGVTDLAGEVIARKVVDLDVDHEPARTLDVAARTALDQVRRSGLQHGGILGLGVAVSAPVAAATHALESARILPDWRGIDVAAELAERTGLHVEIGNDANLGAIAEHRFGIAAQIDDFVYVMLSDGVGAGLVLDGTLYEGAIGGAGELGHVPVAPHGFVCRCGNRGCLETVAGAHSITAAFRLTRGDTVTLADVLAADRHGDAGATRVLADAGRAVGRALIPVCTVLDPALVVIGGESSASQALLEAVRDELANGMTPLRNGAIPVSAGALGEEAEVLGAIALVSRRMDLAAD